MPLRAVVIGAGWAGEGHTIALREAGVEVAALCGRTPDPAYAKATQLGIPEVRFDWAKALEEFRPDIVTIATPGNTHREMAEQAAALGCHIVCEKPLALHANDARVILDAAKRAGVKTAYAATGRYAPAVIHAATLVAQDTIGSVSEIISSVRMDMPDVPYCWVHDLARGGGMLNNVFTHKLAQVVRITGGRPIASMGTASAFRKPVPVGPAIHDFRNLFGPIEGWDASQATEWRKADADQSYTVLVRLLMPQGHIAEALFHGSASGQSPDNGQPIAIYGDGGTLAFNSE